MSESKFKPAFVVRHHLTSDYGLMNRRLFANLYLNYCVITYKKH